MDISHHYPPPQRQQQQHLQNFHQQQLHHHDHPFHHATTLPLAAGTSPTTTTPNTHSSSNDDTNQNFKDNNDDSFPPRLLNLPATAAPRTVAKLKRLCRFPGCNKVIKSQGLCQRHGARAKRCRVEGCEKQAQGTHDGMCKRHWKSKNFPQPPAMEEEEEDRQMPIGDSAYDNLLPKSIAYRPDSNAIGSQHSKPSGGFALMPLVVALKDGFETKEAGWHRNAERLSRGLLPVTSLTNQFEYWEKQMVWTEILLLSGGTPGANFDHLAHAWGREHNFHSVLIQTICSRRGDLGRKRRADATTMGPSSSSSSSLLPNKQPRFSRHRPLHHDGLGGGDDDVVPNVDGDPNRPTENIYVQAARIMAANDDDEDDNNHNHNTIIEEEDHIGDDDDAVGAVEQEVAATLVASPFDRTSMNTTSSRYLQM